ncbi:hypothetical protein IMY05_C0771000600 [Salix suchowensis]|nr:hypothetical protein IMY05_C0771000600 [Salix suchowensis]
MDAFSRLLSAMNDQAPDQCISAAMLTTYAATVWMINGVHSRPDNQTGGRACRDVALPKYVDYSHDDLVQLGYDDNTVGHVSDDPTVTFSPYGVLFMRRIYFPPESNTVRLPIGERLSLEHYPLVFGKTLQELRRMFGATGITRRRDLPHTRFSMNKGMSRPRTGPSTIDVPPNFFGLDAVEEMITLETGPDVDAANQVQVLEPAPRKPWNRRLWTYGNSFPAAFFRRSATRKTGRSRATGSGESGNEERVAARVRCHLPTERPRPTTERSMLAVYDLLPRLENSISVLNETNAKEVRNVIWKEFKKLTWIPNATNDRPWRSNRMGAPWLQFPKPGSNSEDPSRKTEYLALRYYGRHGLKTQCFGIRTSK